MVVSRKDNGSSPQGRGQAKPDRATAKASDADAIGVLALQGGVQEHLDHLARLGVKYRPVRQESELAGLAGLILPGGESTCLSRLFRLFGLDRALRYEHERGMKLWGTCAGAILLARENVGETSHLALMDLAVQRNAFGSQLDSFRLQASVPQVSPTPVPLVFIRAPKIVRVGKDVDVLLRQDDWIAAAEDRSCLATCFHPELTPSLAFHRYFAAKCGLTAESLPVAQEAWSPQSWMRYSS